LSYAPMFFVNARSHFGVQVIRALRFLSY